MINILISSTFQFVGKEEFYLCQCKMVAVEPLKFDWFVSGKGLQLFDSYGFKVYILNIVCKWELSEFFKRPIIIN